MTAISIIAAIAENGIIGRNNRLPWGLADDLLHFRKLTFGKPIIMGRRTYESFSRPLPNRANIIITSNQHYTADGCIVVNSLCRALACCSNPNIPEAMIIGGATLYTEALPLVSRMYLTLIHKSFQGDTSFPYFNPTAWTEVEREDRRWRGPSPLDYSFVTLIRKV